MPQPAQYKVFASLAAVADNTLVKNTIKEVVKMIKDRNLKEQNISYLIAKNLSVITLLLFNGIVINYYYK